MDYLTVQAHLFQILKVPQDILVAVLRTKDRVHLLGLLLLQVRQITRYVLGAEPALKLIVTVKEEHFLYGDNYLVVISVLPELWVLQVLLDLSVLLVLPDLLEPQVLKVPQVPQVLPDLQVLKVPQVPLVLLALQEKQVLLVLWVNKVSRDQLAQLFSELSIILRILDRQVLG